MLRRLSTFATLVSLVLFLAILAAWITSRPYPTVYAGDRNTSHWQVESCRGRFVIARFRVICHKTSADSYDLLTRALYIYNQDPAVLLAPPSIANAFGFGHGGWHGHESDNI